MVLRLPRFPAARLFGSPFLCLNMSAVSQVSGSFIPGTPLSCADSPSAGGSESRWWRGRQPQRPPSFQIPGGRLLRSPENSAPRAADCQEEAGFGSPALSRQPDHQMTPWPRQQMGFQSPRGGWGERQPDAGVAPSHILIWLGLSHGRGGGRLSALMPAPVLLTACWRSPGTGSTCSVGGTRKACGGVGRAEGERMLWEELEFTEKVESGL